MLQVLQVAFAGNFCYGGHLCVDKDQRRATGVTKGFAVNRLRGQPCCGKEQVQGQ